MAVVETEQDKWMEVVVMSRELSIYEAMGGTYTEVVLVITDTKAMVL